MAERRTSGGLSLDRLERFFSELASDRLGYPVEVTIQKAKEGTAA